MSMVSHASGARYTSLIGGSMLSFYDWYCDLPPASPETWGEQTDVNESADWYNAKLLAVMGSNLNMTRTPDCHFAAEARHNGTKMVVFAPDFNQVAKYADEWVPINAGQDGAWWMAVVHVLLKEFHHDRQIPYFVDYAKRYSDGPFLVELVEDGGAYKPGQLLRAGRLPAYAAEEHPEWKFLVWDAKDARPKMPMGSAGHRWGQKKGNWNLKLVDGVDGSEIDPTLTFLGQADEVPGVRFDDFGEGTVLTRGVPARRIKTRRRDGPGHHGLRPADGPVRRAPRPAGRLPADYDDEDRALHAGLVRALHRHEPRDDPAEVRPRVGRPPPSSPAASARSSSAPASTTGITAT